MYLMLKIKVPTNIEKDFSAVILTSHQKAKQNSTIYLRKQINQLQLLTSKGQPITEGFTSINTTLSVSQPIKTHPNNLASTVVSLWL